MEDEAALLVAFRNAAEDLESQTDYSYEDLRDVIDQLQEEADEF